MPEFLELLDNIRAEEASTERLFAREGVNVSALARTRRGNPRYMSLLAEAATFVAEVFEGRRPLARLQEAMTTSDFPLLFGDILDRQLLGNYEAYPTNWSAIARRATVRDFRSVKRFVVDGGRAELEKVKERGQYPERSKSEDSFTYAVEKYGARFDWSWEDMVNDDLDALKSSPEDLAIAARHTEDRFVTGLFATSAGPDSTFFSAGNGNVITGNPALSIAALQTAMQVIAAQTDPDGNPIYVEMLTLVVPPALEITARNILNAIQIELVEAGGTSNQKLIAQNWMRNRVQLNVNPWLSILDTTHGSTAWYLFASPSAGRPAMEIGFLRGHEQPALFQKDPNARRVGGAGVDPMDGDFDSDSIAYKVRHVIGGTLIDPKMAAASQGDGS